MALTNVAKEYAWISYTSIPGKRFSSRKGQKARKERREEKEE